METLEYRTIDKSTWGDGPWMTEPDKRQWPDPATGLPCLIVRTHMGQLCGYVGVAEGHPLFGKQDGDGGMPWLECHGGITFTDKCNPAETAEHGICHIPGVGEPDHVWWFGFDAAHSGDFVPGMESKIRSLGVPRYQHHDTYRDLAYMTSHVTALAAQLRALA